MDANQRRHLRLVSLPGSHVTVFPDQNNTTTDSLSPLVCLLMDESLKGCGLVSLATPVFTVGYVCMVKFGDTRPLKATVRWIKLVDTRVMTMGLEFEGLKNS